MRGKEGFYAFDGLYNAVTNFLTVATSFQFSTQGNKNLRVHRVG
jgi:hypothetical protein